MPSGSAGSSPKGVRATRPAAPERTEASAATKRANFLNRKRGPKRAAHSRTQFPKLRMTEQDLQNLGERLLGTSSDTFSAGARERMLDEDVAVNWGSRAAGPCSQRSWRTARYTGPRSECRAF